MYMFWDENIRWYLKDWIQYFPPESALSNLFKFKCLENIWSTLQYSEYEILKDLPEEKKET